MYRILFSICMFMIYIHCISSAPPALLSALLAGPTLNERQEQTGSTTYDQKQSGKYNIHLNIKDVAIIALDGGNSDSDIGDFGEDYYVDYDLSDFTVKPIFGLIDITSEKPSSTPAPAPTPAPALIHSEPDSELTLLFLNNTLHKFSSNVTVEEPIIKVPFSNKTQSVVILNESSTSSAGIVVTTPTSENTQSKLKPNEIPVQVVIEPVQSNSQTLRHQSDWRLRNRFRSTPSNIRRITPPRNENIGSSQIGSDNSKDKIHNSIIHKNQHRNCVVDQHGKCHSSRRFSSPIM